MNYQKAFLIILDGWGLGKDPDRSAISHAYTPVMDALWKQNPKARLRTDGENVGLPAGQMGNSEVGHINIGAGRIVYQELLRINKALQDDSLTTNPAILGILHYLQDNPASKLHLMGLVSNGGVHSHMDHLIALVKFFEQRLDQNIMVHAFTDGRDCDPKSGKAFIQQVMETFSPRTTLASVVGRYYAMDRDKRWERTLKAYDLLVRREGEASSDIVETIQKRYDEGQTDEFLEPILLDPQVHGHTGIEDRDAVLFFNFRTDRPRQLTEMLTQKSFPDLNVSPLDLHYVTMTPYDNTYSDIQVVFDKQDVEMSMGEYISGLGITQVRIAETEKYPHVTYFFSGGREKPFPGEHRILVNSPKVATYDLKPEMSAKEVTQALLHYLEDKTPGFICLNFANADMVGHTGKFKAGIRAVETVDSCLGKLLEKANALDYHCIIIADHGNADAMINPDGSPHTAHTLNPVPIVYVGPAAQQFTLADGILADIAPTLLYLMGLNKPSEMTGTSLISEIPAEL